MRMPALCCPSSAGRQRGRAIDDEADAGFPATTSFGHGPTPTRRRNCDGFESARTLIEEEMANEDAREGVVSVFDAEDMWTLFHEVSRPRAMP